MAYRKVKDLSVVTGEYEQNGETKKRWQNMGCVMKNEEGKSFMLMDRWFNPAGVPFKAGTDQIVVAIFDLRDDAQTAQNPRSRPAPSQRSEDDDIPF